MPGADPAVRAELEAEEAAYGVRWLYERLRRQDPEAAARLHPNDSQRIQRALEVQRLSGRTMSELQRQPGMPGLGERPIKAILEPQERAWLHRRIETRFRAMLAAGLVGEVVALHRRGDLTMDLPSVRAVGYRQAWYYLEGAYAYHSMVRHALRATRQYAKRQMTGLRRHTDAARLAADGDGLERLPTYLAERIQRL